MTRELLVLSPASPDSPDEGLKAEEGATTSFLATPPQTFVRDRTHMFS